MFGIKLETLVNSLVSALLQDKGRENEGLLFSFDVSLSVYLDSGEEFSRRQGLHLFYYVKPEYIYISVFSAITPRPFDPAPTGPEGWTHEVTHDSCWRNDVSAISSLYFGMAESINQELEAAGHKRVAPKEMHMNVFPASTGRRDLYQWVPCTIAKDPTDSNRYHRTLTLGKKAAGK